MFFRVKKEKLYNPEIGFYMAYGVEAIGKDSKITLAEVSDVFLHENEAKKFVELLNDIKPEPVHLEELCMAAIE